MDMQIFYCIVIHVLCCSISQDKEIDWTCCLSEEEEEEEECGSCPSVPMHTCQHLSEKYIFVKISCL